MQQITNYPPSSLGGGMKYRKLGKSGLDVSSICVGAMSFGDLQRWPRPWLLNQDQSTEIVKHALDMGVNWFDTANMYDLGGSEEYLGEALKRLKPNREELVIQTKVSCKMAEGPNRQGNSRKEILNEIANEIDDRNMGIPNELINSIELYKLSPNLIYNVFIRFVESPSILTANQLFQAFIGYPALHLLCINSVFTLSKIKARKAFEMLGNCFMKEGSLPFSLSYFYHQSIKEFIDEVEFSNYNPKNSNREIIEDFINENNESIISFLIPFLFEFPQWIDYFHDINAKFYNFIIDSIEKIS